MACRNHSCFPMPEALACAKFTRAQSFRIRKALSGKALSHPQALLHLQTFFFAITTAPIIATSSKIDAISNGSMYSPNKTLPTSCVLGSSAEAGAGSPSGNPPRPTAIAIVSCAPSTSYSSKPSHHCRLYGV